MLSNVSPYLSLCSTITAFNHRREQHCSSHFYSPLSLSHSLTHSLTAISCTSEHHLFSSTAQFHLSACCLLTTAALSLAGFEAVGLQTSRRPSVRPSEKLLRRSPSSKGRTGGGGGKRKEEEAWKGRSGEGLAHAQLGQGIKALILSLLCVSKIKIIQHQHQVHTAIRPCRKC